MRGYEEREITGDSASMRRNNPQVGELASKSITGYGLGWRMGLDNGLNVNLDVAVAANAGLITPSNRASGHLSAVWWF